MSTITHPVVPKCPNCGVDLPLNSLACPACHALIYSERLDQLAADARALEMRGRLPQARELWLYALGLLPHDSKQAAWIGEHLRALELAQSGAQGSEAELAQSGQVPSEQIQSGQSQSGQSQSALSQSNPSQLNPAPAKPAAPVAHPSWIKKLGPFGPLALLLLKLKTGLLLLFKLKFLFSFLFFIALYVGMFGWRYGLGISACILIHEMGHFIDIKRRGLPAEMPVFLPGFGAYVRWNGLGVTLRHRAQISLAGPLAGWIAAAVCFLIYGQTGDPIWAALARTGAVLNVLNLIPIWVLDGGQAIAALAQVERAALLAVSLGLWYYSGQGIFFFVAAGFAWRLFTKDKPQQSDWSTWAYYVALLVALAVILHAAPDALARQGMPQR